MGLKSDNFWQVLQLRTLNKGWNMFQSIKDVLFNALSLVTWQLNKDDLLQTLCTSTAFINQTEFQLAQQPRLNGNSKFLNGNSSFWLTVLYAFQLFCVSLMFQKNNFWFFFQFACDRFARSNIRLQAPLTNNWYCSIEETVQSYRKDTSILVTWSNFHVALYLRSEPVKRFIFKRTSNIT